MANQGKRKKGKCGYCGEICLLTRDHVIPKSLFLRPLPADIVTVPACDDCNSRKSKHDDFLRDLLTSDIAGSESPIAHQIFLEKVLSSNRQGKSLVARIAIQSARRIPIKTPSGLIVGDGYVARIDHARTIEMFEFIVRGLYFRLRNHVLPKDYEFQALRQPPIQMKSLLVHFEKVGINGPYSIGKGVFSCWYNYAAQDEATTIWLLSFYERVFYSVVTSPKVKSLM